MISKCNITILEYKNLDILYIKALLIEINIIVEIYIIVLIEIHIILLIIWKILLVRINSIKICRVGCKTSIGNIVGVLLAKLLGIRLIKVQVVYYKLMKVKTLISELALLKNYQLHLTHH